MTRYFARSASDKTDDWPWWFVADRQKGDLNVTAELLRMHVDQGHRGGVFLRHAAAVELAGMANEVRG
jgi:hypothetical protein